MGGTGKIPSYYIWDDVVGKGVAQTAAQRRVVEWFEKCVARNVGKTPREEPDMRTYEYEIVVHPEKDEDGMALKGGREAQVVAHEAGLLEEPTREDLLLLHAEALNKLGVKGAEVSVNIRPFC